MAYLPNKTHVFDRGESVENYWNRIWNEICKNYKLSKMQLSTYTAMVPDGSGQASDSSQALSLFWMSFMP